MTTLAINIYFAACRAVAVILSAMRRITTNITRPHHE
jgi:hypothetical protein